MNVTASEGHNVGLVGLVGNVGQEVLQAQSNSLVPTTRSTTRKPKTAKRANGQAATTATADPNIRVCSITLPKDVFERYEQAAAAAPFEPSVQRYLSWELRELDKKRQAEQKSAALAQGLQARGFVPSAADGPQLDDFGR